MASDFAAIGLSQWLIDSLNSLGVKKPSAIQSQAIPIILSQAVVSSSSDAGPSSSFKSKSKTRRDVFACSPTGSGKTLAYVLPILELLMRDPRPYFALILAPTRELAYQISEIIKVLTGTVRSGTYSTVKTLLLIGGGNASFNISEGDEAGRDLWFGKPNVIIATPGRLVDILTNRNYLDVYGQRRTLKFEMLVLDEAAQLVQGGFVEQIKTILEWVDGYPVTLDAEAVKARRNKSNRQTLVFSATLTSALEALSEIISAKESSLRPAMINLLPTMEDVTKELSTNPNLVQNYLLCPEQVKVAYLIECILDLSFKQCILFCGTRREAKLMYKVMLALGLDSDEFKLHPVILNSDLPQRARFAALNQFKSLKSRLLVTTDLANRGLDLPQVDLVINFNCPADPIKYVHRVGRTCRKIDFKRESLLVNKAICIGAAVENSDSEDDEASIMQRSKKDLDLLKDVKLPVNKIQLTERQQRSVADNKDASTDDTAGSQTTVKIDYAGKSVTIVTQYDVKLLQNIEKFIGIRMGKEEGLDEDNVTVILRQVSIAIKDAEIRLEQEETSDDAPAFLKARRRAAEERQAYLAAKRKKLKKQESS